MVAKAAKLSLIALAFCGWVLLLAGICYMQNKVGRNTPNFPVSGVVPGGNAANGLPQWINPAIYSAYSYIWWLTWFELVVLILCTITVAKHPKMRHGVTALLAVLTTSIFLFSSELYNSTYGIFAMTHTVDFKNKIPTKDNLGQQGYDYYKGLATMFAGMIILDVTNALLLLTLPILSDEEEERLIVVREDKTGAVATDATAAAEVAV